MGEGGEGDPCTCCGCCCFCAGWRWRCELWFDAPRAPSDERAAAEPGRERCWRLPLLLLLLLALIALPPRTQRQRRRRRGPYSPHGAVAAAAGLCAGGLYGAIIIAARAGPSKNLTKK